MTTRPESTRPESTLAERKRRLVSGELTETALQLFVQQGFDAVTVDEIAAAAGMSKRTFFRYFASKEDVVVQFLADLGAGMRAELAARPPEESTATALQHAVRSCVDACAGHADKALRVVRLILGTPSLHARFLERQAQWRDDLAAELAIRLALPSPTALHPRLAAGLALTVFEVVLQLWSDGDGAEDPSALTARAFAAVAPALDAVGR
ncbi:TetR family transcriptional regulator [Kitasatospora sp. CB01950]|nr:TetR family transcriptional regulator [Kitasatospora sp. CB01950]